MAGIVRHRRCQVCAELIPVKRARRHPQSVVCGGGDVRHRVPAAAQGSPPKRLAQPAHGARP